MRFSEPNANGVLEQPEIYIPLRMIPNVDATEVELVLFRQSNMSDADF